MPAPHLTPLYAQYGALLQTYLVNQTFDSHDFILKLAQQNQVAYVKALSQYTNGNDPFRQLHRILSTHIGTFVGLVVRLPQDADSPDIFKDVVSNAAWQRI